MFLIPPADEVDKRHAKPATAARAVYQEQSEVRAQLQCAKGGFGARELSADDKAQKAASEVIKAMNKLLKEHDYLPQKKRLYVEYGCRWAGGTGVLGGGTGACGWAVRQHVMGSMGDVIGRFGCMCAGGSGARGWAVRVM